MKALRTLCRAPGFSITVVLTLALGIGPGTAVFSAIDRLLLRSLPYSDPDRLVSLHETQAGKGARPVSLPNLSDWRAQSASFDTVAGFRPGVECTEAAAGHNPARVVTWPPDLEELACANPGDLVWGRLQRAEGCSPTSNERESRRQAD